MLSDVMEDYLKIIYELQAKEGPPVSTAAIAEASGKTPPTVTSMLESLTERGLVEREKYKGVELTPEGETVALEVLRHHRLLEAYLAEALDYDWSEVHDEADALEHHISEEFERRVAEQLDDPDVDPHGDPIPTETLDPLDHAESALLGDLPEGERVVVCRVSDRDPEELAYLQQAGITPGTELTITEVAPIGVVTVSLVSGDSVSLSDEVADSIRVEPAEEPATNGAV